MAYNLHNDDGNYADRFLRQIEPLAAYIPYMTAAGNHEANFNFSYYKHLFTMKDSFDNQYYR